MFQNRAAYVGFYQKIRFVFPPLAVILAISYYLAMKNDFDHDIGHFATDSLPFGIATAAVFLSIAAALIAALPSMKSVSVVAMPKITVPSIFVSVFGAVVTVAMLIDYLTDRSLGFPYTKFAQFAAILLPFLGIALALSLFDRTAEGWFRLGGFLLSALSINLTMFSCYFDFALPLNSPIRNLTVILQACILLQLLSEARFGLGAHAVQVTPFFFVLTSALASSLTLGLSGGALLNHFLNPIPGDPNLSPERLILYAALGLLGMCRLFTIAPMLGEYDPTRKREKKKKNKKSPQTAETV